MPTGSRKHDIVVIGGGPAGSSAAIVLGSAGLDVALFERSRFPRHHIGESLLARTVPYFERLGVWEDLIAQNYVRKPGALFVWGGGRDPITLEMPPPGYCFQVPRAKFDAFMLARARQRGVIVHEEHDAREVVAADGGVSVTGTHAGEPWNVTADYVIDATGGSKLTSRTAKVNEYDGARIAVSAYFTGARPIDAPDEGRIITETCDSGWIWLIPLGGGLTSVGLVSDARRLRQADSPTAALREELATAPFTGSHLCEARMTDGASVIRYANYAIDAPKWDGRVVRVGDSAMFVDPLFSTGVHGAVSSGYMAGAALRSALGGTMPHEAAVAAYNRQCAEYFERTRETVRLLYGFHPGRAEFWTSRAIPEMTPAEAAASVAVLGVPGAAIFDSLIGRMPMPEAFVRELGHLVLPDSIQPARAGSALRLRADVVVSPDGVFRGMDMVPGYSIRTPSGHTAALTAPRGGRQEQLVRDLVAARSAGRDLILGEQHNEVLAGALISSQNVIAGDHPAG